MDFPMVVWLFWMGFINVLFKVMTKLKFYKLFFKKPQVNHRLGHIDLKIYSLERNPRLWLNSWQSLQTFAKIISVTSISVQNSEMIDIEHQPS